MCSTVSYSADRGVQPLKLSLGIHHQRLTRLTVLRSALGVFFFYMCSSNPIRDPSVLLYVTLYLDYWRPPYTYSSRHLTVASLHCSNLQGSLHREAVNRVGLGQEI